LGQKAVSLKFIYTERPQKAVPQRRKPRPVGLLDIGIGLAIGAALAYFCIF